MNKNILLVAIGIVILIGVYFIGRNTGSTTINNATMPKSSEMGHGDHAAHAALVKDDKSFIEEMIPHHEEAITSSESLLKISKTAEVRSLAQDIIDAQEKEVADMKAWYKEWFGQEYKPTGNYKPMMSPIDEKNIEASEQQYLKDMMMHHEAAIVMAEKVLPLSKQDEIKNLANDIITSQQKEIDIMRSLSKDKDQNHSIH